MLRLALRTLPLFAVIVAGAIALGLYMTWSGVRTTQLGLIDGRMRMVVTDVAQVVEQAVTLGIAPAEQVTLPDLLARQRAADPAIRDIRLVGPDGRVLFAAEGGAMAAAPALAERAISNDFGVEVARLVVVYDTAPAEQALRMLGAAMAAEALPAGIAATLLGSLAAFLVLTQLQARGARLVQGAAGPLDAAEAEVDGAAGPDQGAGR
jgi:hypothetical protein